METFTAIEYLKIAISNTFGLDKLTWHERIHWADNFLQSVASEQKVLIHGANEPLLMQKAVTAYESAMIGEPTGYIMGLDATASGIQLMACLIGCHDTAKAVNLIDTGYREDVYTDVAIEMGTTRVLCKPAVMTHFYGSKKQPESVFGEEVDKFYEAMERTLPGACEAMRDMQSCWQPFAKKHEFTLPDGHVASIKVMVPVDKRIEVDELDHATFTHRAYENMGTERGLSLAANIIHATDGYVVREMYRMAKDQNFELLTIHDSFWCSPNYAQNIRQNYADILAGIADSDLMQDILRQVTGNGFLTYDKFSKDLGSLIRASNYALS